MNTNRNQQPIRIEAKSVEQAITLACVKLNVSKEALAYKVLKEPKQGLVSFFMGAKAEIEAWPRAAGQRGHKSDRKGAEHGPSHGRSHGYSQSIAGEWAERQGQGRVTVGMLSAQVKPLRSTPRRDLAEFQTQRRGATMTV
jgi:predicted RNA-binding protein Jag